MADVWTENRQGSLTLRSQNLVWFARRILDALALNEASLSVVITDAADIRALNRRYLKRDRPTNVISFPMQEGEAVAGDKTYLGDIVISADAALEEGRAYGYRPDEMLLIYLIHGILHLSGFNHENVGREESIRMEKKQAEMVASFLPELAKHPLTEARPHP